MKMKIAITITVCALLGAFTFFSCDNPIGLGKRLNLEPPVVTIEKPGFMENVSGLLEITGTATDLEEIVYLMVTVERVSKTGAEWKQEWQGERGMWRSSSNAPTRAAAWTEQGGKGNIHWSITVSLEGAPNGEYVITAGAENNVQNAGALLQRRVVIDTDPPVVTIIMPTDPALKDSFLAFDDYKLQDPTIMDRLHNEVIKVQYEVEDDFSLEKLVFQLADYDGNIYYNKAGTPIANPNWNGRLEIPASEIVDADGNEITDKLYLQLISTAADRAENAKIHSHGWLVYWPESDKPWTTGVGHADDPQKFPVYPRTEVQGQAYDDDGVQQVSLQIFKKSSGEPYEGYENPVVLTNTPLLAGSDPSIFFPWHFTSPELCDEYTIVLTCLDKDGVEGDTVIRYFYVLDTSASSVEVKEPDVTKTLFGDANGDFAIKGTAGDGVDPSRLTVVWLNPAGDSESQILYQSSDYEGWGSPAAGNRTDDQGNKLWEVTMDAEHWDEILKRMYRDFTLNLNLFDDLGIGVGEGNIPLSAQSFVLRVEGANGKATTVLHSVRGDITPPELTIAKVTIRRGVVDKEYTLADLENEAMNALETGDEVYVTGAWNDDSFISWPPSPPGGAPRMGQFQVLWNGESIPNATLNTSSPTTWTAGPLTLDEEQITGGGRIEARLRDYGGNLTVAAFSARVDSNIPMLMFVSSDKPDGAYNAGEEIDIYLEFNKEVSYNGGGPLPTLTLSNGYTATYTHTDPPQPYSGKKHTFKYTIVDGHDADRLGVELINPVENWGGSGGKAVMTIPHNQNLQDLKNIRIDTTKPSIVSIESLTGDTGDNYYREGRTIYLLIHFNEDIAFSGSGATLTLNANYNSSGSPTGTVTAANPVLSGTSALLFTYVVENGNNTPFTPPTTYGDPLAASTFAPGGATITDLAGNPLSSNNIPGSGNIVNAGKKIYIDTTKPAVPAFGAGSSPADTYTDPANAPPKFTLTGEPGATFEYSIDNGAKWIPYNGEVALRGTGTYNVTARQKDLAGNVSLNITPSRNYEVKTNIPLLTNLSASTPGTYKTGDVIDIEFNLREPVTVTGNFRLALNAAAGRYTAAAPTVISSDTLVFKYTVQSGDSANHLEITGLDPADLSGVTLTGGGSNLTTELMTEWTTNNWGTAEGKKLSDVSPIDIDTLIPALAGTPTLSSNGETLTLNFNKEIYKGTGNIRLVQQGTYLAPAVLTKEQYLRYGGSALNSYYTVGTNGTDQNGNADLTEKYILNYDIETNNSDLTSALIARGAHSVTVPIVSGAVAIASDRRSLTVNLGTQYGFVLQVKGVSYGVYFDQNLVQDSLQNQIATYGNFNTLADPGNPGTTLAYAGVNEPFIRVQKESGTIQPGANKQVPGQPTGQTRWVKNANFSTTPTSPSGNNWQVEPFRLQFPVDPTNSASFSGTTWGMYFNKNDQNTSPGNFYIPSSIATINARLYQEDNTDNFRIPESWWWNDTHIVHENDRNNIRLNFWVNPYVNTNTIIYPVSGNAAQGQWTLLGNLWVDISTSGASVLNQTNAPAESGYIRVFETGAPGTIQVPDAVQPRTAAIKIDCQTPNATIAYGYNTGNNGNQYGGGTNEKYPRSTPLSNSAPSVTMPQTTTGATVNGSYNRTNHTGTGGNPITLGTTTATDLNGYLYGIIATATNGTSVSSWEKAARSVIQFNDPPFNGGLLGVATQRGRDLQLWLRGGDQLSGDNSTPGFPLSWNEKDHTPGPSSAQLLTQDGNNWYWITWGVTVPAYFHFIAGTTSSADEAVRGPHDWVYSKNAWSYMKESYPLRPGESLLFRVNTEAASPSGLAQPTGDYEFFGSFTSSR